MPRVNLDEYVTVAERIAQFYLKHPRGVIQTELLHDDGKRVIVKALVYRDENERPAIGHAEEIRGDGPVNKTSALENCESSAVGRAIAMLGFEVKKGVASRDEVERALEQQDNGKPDPSQATLVRAAELRSRIKLTGLIDESRMKLTSMGVEKLPDLSEEQFAEFGAWLSATADEQIERTT